jgi:hypothetical protein
LSQDSRCAATLGYQSVIPSGYLAGSPWVALRFDPRLFEGDRYAVEEVLVESGVVRRPIATHSIRHRYDRHDPVTVTALRFR